MPAEIIFDGNFTDAFQSGDYRISRPIKEDPGSALVVAVEHTQLRANWAPLALNAIGPVVQGLQTYSVDETELIDMGGGIVKWDRIYATIPFPRVEESTVAKTIKHLIGLFNPDGVYLTANIVSLTKTMRCHIHYNYGFSPGALEGIPDVMLYTPFGSGGTGSSVLLINGWPAVTAGNPINNNEGTSLVGGDIGTYMGGIRFRKRIYAPV